MADGSQPTHLPDDVPFGADTGSAEASAGPYGAPRPATEPRVTGAVPRVTGSERAARVRADPAMGLRWSIVVGAVMAIGIGTVALGAWRVGCIIIGVSLLVGAAIRLVVSRDGAGLLRVRARVTDTALMTLLGVGIIVMVLVRT